MKNKIIGYTLDIGMAALMYYGLYVGNEYAENIFWPTLYVFMVLSALAVMTISNEKHKKEIAKTRKPRAPWENTFSLIYNIVFSVSLAAVGFAWSAGAWFIINLIARACTESIDKELRGDQ